MVLIFLSLSCVFMQVGICGYDGHTGNHSEHARSAEKDPDFKLCPHENLTCHNGFFNRTNSSAPCDPAHFYEVTEGVCIHCSCICTCDGNSTIFCNISLCKEKCTLRYVVAIKVFQHMQSRKQLEKRLKRITRQREYFSNTVKHRDTVILLLSSFAVSVLLTGLAVKHIRCKNREEDHSTQSALLSSSPEPDGSRTETCETSISLESAEPQKQELARIVKEALSIGSKLGEGHFCQVLTATWESKTVAVKQLKRDKGVAGVLDGAFEKTWRQIIQEAVLINQLRHPNIIQIHGICNDSRGPSLLVIEYMDQGSLDVFIVKNREVLDPSQMIQAALGVAKGGKYLHDMLYIHRDIAARNVLCAGEPNSFVAVKLSDFGLAKDISTYRTYQATDVREILPHPIPPENQLGLPTESSFSFYTDVWYYGAFLWEIYALLKDEKIVDRRMLDKTKFDPKTAVDSLASPQMIKTLIKLCSSESYAERPGFIDIVDVIQKELDCKSSSSYC